MSCEGCFQTLKSQNEQRERIVQTASREAKEQGEWYIVYQEPGTGEYKYIKQQFAGPGLPNPMLISPKLYDTKIQQVH